MIMMKKIKFSPYMWRWTWNIIDKYIVANIFSIYVEMNLVTLQQKVGYLNFLHICGDEPLYHLKHYLDLIIGNQLFKKSKNLKWNIDFCYRTMSRMQFSVNSIVKNYYINIVLYNWLKFLYFNVKNLDNELKIHLHSYWMN